MAASPTQAPTEMPTIVPTATFVPILRLMMGLVVEVVERNDGEIELLRVQHFSGKVWEFITEGPIGIDGVHLLAHRDTGEGVEVVFLDTGGRLIALEVNDPAH